MLIMMLMVMTIMMIIMTTPTIGFLTLDFLAELNCVLRGHVF
jgi:hypothetical protein